MLINQVLDYKWKQCTGLKAQRDKTEKIKITN